jgi:Tfp pilus assembly protein PilV
MRRKELKQNEGFTLLETVVSIILTTTILVGFLNYGQYTRQMNHLVETNTRALFLSQAIIEKMIREKNIDNGVYTYALDHQYRVEVAIVAYYYDNLKYIEIVLIDNKTEKVKKLLSYFLCTG